MTVIDNRLDTRRPFTRADAIAAGISPKQLRGSRFRKIFRGVLVEASVPDNPFVRAKAATLIHPPEAFASHLSAARLRRVPVPDHPFEHVTVWKPEHRVFRAGLKPHVTKFATEDDVEVKQGIRLSKPCRMFVELATVLGLVDLVVVGDALVRLRLTTRQELVDYCAKSRSGHAGDARRAAAYVREQVESAMETRLRMLIVLAGLPEPEVNLVYRDADGTERYRFDLSYPRLRLVVEYDGRQHAEDPAQWNRDLERREFLDDEEIKILVVTSRGVFREPEVTIERVRRALSKRGCHVPREALSQEWRPFFGHA